MAEFAEDLLVELVLSRLPLDAQARCRCLSKGFHSALLRYHFSTGTDSVSVTGNPNWVFGVYSVNKESRQHQVLKAWNRDGRCFTFTLSFLPQFRSPLPPIPCATAGPCLFFACGSSYERGICQANPLKSSFKWLPNPPMQNIQSFKLPMQNIQFFQHQDRRLCCHRKLTYDGIPLCPAYRGTPDNYVLLDCGPSCCQMYHAGEGCWKIITIPPPVAKVIPALDSHCMTFFRDSFYCLYEGRDFAHVVVLSCDMDAPLPSWVLLHKLPPLGRSSSSFKLISCRPHIYEDAITLVCLTVVGITNWFSLRMLPLGPSGFPAKVKQRWERVDFPLPPMGLRSSQPNNADLCCVWQDDLLWFYRKSSSSSRYTKGFQKLHCYCLSSKSWVCNDASPDDSCVLELSGLGTFYPSFDF